MFGILRSGNWQLLLKSATVRDFQRWARLASPRQTGASSGGWRITQAALPGSVLCLLLLNSCVPEPYLQSVRVDRQGHPTAVVDTGLEIGTVQLAIYELSAARQPGSVKQADLSLSCVDRKACAEPTQLDFSFGRTMLDNGSEYLVVALLDGELIGTRIIGYSYGAFRSRGELDFRTGDGSLLDDLRNSAYFAYGENRAAEPLPADPSSSIPGDVQQEANPFAGPPIVFDGQPAELPDNAAYYEVFAVDRAYAGSFGMLLNGIKRSRFRRLALYGCTPDTQPGLAPGGGRKLRHRLDSGQYCLVIINRDLSMQNENCDIVRAKLYSFDEGGNPVEMHIPGLDSD